MEYIRKTYGVPAKVGGRVFYKGRPGRIVGAEGAYLRVRLDGENSVGSYHPTWEMAYDLGKRGE